MSKKLLPNDDVIIKLYLDENKTCKDICRIFGLSPNTSGGVSKILKRNGIEIRKDAGKNHHNWKGGRIIKGSGYYGIWNPDHQRADNQGYVFEHTLVWEKHNGYLPKRGDNIHHIDLNKLNNNIDNLYLCKHKEHAIIHRSIEKLIPELLKRNIIIFKGGEYIFQEK